jgi:hypothetical protein
VTVTPAVSEVNVVAPQPLEDAIPDSVSLTFQVIVTRLRYHPLLPTVPETFGVITGGVVSASALANAAAWLGINLADTLEIPPPIAARLCGSVLPAQEIDPVK